MAETTNTRELNGLIVRCRDDSRTYRDTADVYLTHRAELLNFAKRRGAFVNTLSSIVRAGGGLPARSGSMASWVRRFAFGLRVTFMGTGNFSDSLNACAQQEGRTAIAYRRALDDRSWSEEVETLLRTQLDEIEDAHARVRLMRGRA